ncbi:MAG: nitrogen fixation protein NifZ [bacterium]|nr:nitrogen fixation protein NifZ [bacterium]
MDDSNIYKFAIGQKVRLVSPIHNDGTLYGAKRGEQLQEAGDFGFVRNVGYFLDDLVYEVDFVEKGRFLGCKERELIDFEQPWEPPKYEPGIRIKATADLTKNGELLWPKGAQGKITVRTYLDGRGYIYEVRFDQDPSQLSLLFEPQLEPA